MDEVTAEADKFKTCLEDREGNPTKDGCAIEQTSIYITEEAYDKLFNLQDKIASINRIPKPKPKLEKPPKEETQRGKENATTTNATASEDNSSQAEPTGEPAASFDDDADAEREPHEEL